MKKKIDVQDLRIGMWVSELDRPWKGTPFLFQGFEIRTQKEIDDIRGQCQYVYIDVTLGHDVEPRKRPPGPAPTRIVVPEADREIKRTGLEVLKQFQPGAAHTPRYRDLVPVEEEIKQAREIHREAMELMPSILEDVRMGRVIDVPAAKQTVIKLVQSVLRNPDALTLLNQLKHQDAYTMEHCLRVCTLALIFGRHLDFPEEELALLGVGALMHDVGKMKVPSEILNKPGKLTDEEFKIMQTHVPRGVEILERNGGIHPASIQVAKQHHERYDGKGYATGLKGEIIDMFGQIGAIVDVYDAITSDRCYHSGMSAHEALRSMYEWRFQNFHPHLLEQFIQCMGIYPVGSLVELNRGDVGVVITVNRERRLRPKVTLVLRPDKQPYAPPKTVDLMDDLHKSLEIRKVLPAGTHGVNPTAYLPLS